MTTPHDPLAEFSQPGGNPTAEEGLPDEEAIDPADVEQRLDAEPEDAENLTDPEHEADLSTGDA